MKRGYARGEARNEEIRAQLEPLAPGERPRAVTYASVAAVLLAIANAVSTAVGDPTSVEWRYALVLCAILLIAAAGMWVAKYWAVLGFQALLTLQMISAFVTLLRASNLAAVLYCVGVLAICGPLFWALVKAMARIQMPQRPTRSS